MSTENCRDDLRDLILKIATHALIKTTIPKKDWEKRILLVHILEDFIDSKEITAKTFYLFTVLMDNHLGSQQVLKLLAHAKTLSRENVGPFNFREHYINFLRCCFEKSDSDIDPEKYLNLLERLS